MLRKNFSIILSGSETMKVNTEMKAGEPKGEATEHIEHLTHFLLLLINVYLFHLFALLLKRHTGGNSVNMIYSLNELLTHFENREIASVRNHECGEWTEK